MMHTFSPAAILRTISPYAHSMVWSLPGQSVRQWGQPSQVASCGSHSAGMAKPSWAGVLGLGISIAFDAIATRYLA